MIDTGSTTTLLDKTKLQNYERIPLKENIVFNTLNGRTSIDTEIITELPKEFEEKARMCWKLTSFSEKDFDGIIGQNLLKPLQAKINLEDEYIEILGNKIKFLGACPYTYNEVHNLEPIKEDQGVLPSLLGEHLNIEERQSLEKILKKNKDLFFHEGQKLTCTHEIKHEIVTTTDRPIYSKIYRYPQIHEQEINKQIKEMLSQGIIKESNSPYNSPLWVVPKKLDNSGQEKWRIVVDYRKLNEATIDDKFPIPNIETILDKLGRSQYFTTLDLAKGFHQVLVREEDRKKTAFSTPLGHYEFTRMPFGLKNAPATFQRLINSVLREYINQICVVYLDDILIFSSSLKEHVISVQKVLDKLREHNLKIQINKCNFFAKETEYLGHVLTTEGVKPNNKKIEAIQKLQLPETTKQIKSFLGITGYFRKFIRDYAKIAEPMTRYLKKNTRINLNDSSYISSFEKLKIILTDSPVLRYPDFNKKFQLTTDASDFAIGSVLTQEGHPVCYASRTLNKHERSYSVTEKELLAIVWSVNYFRPYIYGRSFDLLTDHQPLKWLQSKHKGKDINHRLQRWLLKLGEYNINIDYIKGKENNAADFLSRINSETGEINVIETLTQKEGEVTPHTNLNFEIDNMSTDNNTIHSQEEEQNDHFAILDTVVNRFYTQIILTNNKTKEIEILNNKRIIYINSEDIQKERLLDIFRRFIKRKGKIGIYSELTEHEYNLVQLKLIELFDTRKINFYKCAYYAQNMKNEEDTYKQIAKYHKYETGHTGINENYAGLKKLIYFKNLKELIQKYINNCDTCNQVKYDRKPIKPKFYHTETPSDINQIVHADIYTNSKNNFLTFLDKFSKHCIIFHLQDRNSITIKEVLRLYFSIRGKPHKIVLDNEFQSINVKDFLRQENIEVHYTKPNNHTGNADIERLHNTISEKLRVFTTEKSELTTKEKIYKCVGWYNNSIHSTTKFKPIDISEGRVDKEKVKTNMQSIKDKAIDKLNKNREVYNEEREEGLVKNYKALRHKEEPRYRKLKLHNVHPSNIKRPLKFADKMDTDTPLDGN